MGQVHRSYEESKQWIDVRNIGKLAIPPFSPCLMIGDESDDLELTACAINDRSVDENFDGQIYVLVMSDATGIKVGGYGRVSRDWPLIGRVNAFELASGVTASITQGYGLSPSRDGNGLSANYYALQSDINANYPFPLGYWHWLGVGSSQPFFNVVGHFKPQNEVNEEMLKNGFVLAWVQQQSWRFPWYGDGLWSNWYDDYYGLSEFSIGWLGFAPPKLEANADLSLLREIVKPDAGIYIPYYVENQYYEHRSGVYALTYYQHNQSLWDRVVLADYGTYEIEIAVSLDPVPFSDDFYDVDPRGQPPVARYYQGVQRRAQPFTVDDFWEWEYEDLVILVNRHDFDTAKSTSQVDTIEHRQQLGARQLYIEGVFGDVTTRKHSVNNATLGLGFRYQATWIGYHDALPDPDKWVIVFIWGSAGHGRPGGALFANSTSNVGRSFEEAWAVVLANSTDINNLFHPLGLVYEHTAMEIGTMVGGLPYLDVFSKQAGNEATFNSQYTSWTDRELGNHVVSRFTLKVGRPETMGEYKGVAKTVLEFRVYNRSDALEVSQRSLIGCRVTKFSGDVDVIK